MDTEGKTKRDVYILMAERVEGMGKKERKKMIKKERVKMSIKMTVEVNEW